MRLAFLAVAAAAVLAGGCNRADAPANRPAPNASAAPDSTATPAGSAGDDARAVATGGAVESSPREAAPKGSARAEREVTLPAGTRLPIILESNVGSDTSHVEERVQARLARAIVVRGSTVVAEGSDVNGVVTDATRSARVKGRAHVAVRFDTLVPRGTGERYAIRTAPVGRMAQATKGKDALEIVGPATGGAVLGRIFGGRKGALIGAAAGGGAGTAVVLSTRGKEVHLPRGAALTLRLTAPVTIRIAS